MCKDKTVHKERRGGPAAGLKISLEKQYGAGDGGEHQRRTQRTRRGVLDFVP